MIWEGGSTMPSKDIISIIGGVVVLFSLIGSYYAFDNTYAREDAVCERIEAVERNSVKTFEAFQAKQQTIDKATKLEVYSVQKDSLDIDYSRLQKQIARDPNNIELKQEFEEVSTQRRRIKNRMDKIVEDIR